MPAGWPHWAASTASKTSARRCGKPSPRRTGQALELALAGAGDDVKQCLRSAGWSIRDAGQVSLEIDGYRVLVDPVWTERTSPFVTLGPKRFHAPPLPLDELPPLDAVVISHDRWFLDRIATHILAFEGDSQVVYFDGNYTQYEADRRRRLGEAADQPHRIKYRHLTRD